MQPRNNNKHVGGFIMEKQLRLEANDALTNANAKQVTDQVTYDAATEFLKSIKGLAKKINEVFEPMVKKAHEAHKEVLTQKKKYTEPLIEAEKVLKSKVGAYVMEQRRLAQIEQKRLEDEARKRAEAERIKREEEALIMAENTTPELADEILEEALEEVEDIPVIATVKNIEQAKGVSTKAVFKWKIKDEAKINRQFMCVDEKKINQLVRTMKKDAQEMVGGIEVYVEEQVAVRL